MYDRLVVEDEKVDFEFLSLSDIWDENDVTLPRRIRCSVHNFALMAVIDFISRRQRDFWNANPHVDFKSMSSIHRLVYCIDANRRPGLIRTNFGQI